MRHGLLPYATRSMVTLAALLAASWSALADEPPRAAVRAVAFSADGKLLVAGVGETKGPGKVVVWDVATRKPRFTHTTGAGIGAVALAPDAKTLALGLYDQTASLLDLGTGQEKLLLVGHGKEVRAIAFSADGQTLATGSGDRTVKLWNVATGAESRTLQGHKDQVLCVTFSPDGKLLLSAAGNDGVTLWDMATGEQKRNWRHGGFYCRCALFADQQSVLTGGYDGTVRLWSTETGETWARFQGFGGVNALAYSPTARRLAVCGYGKNIALFEFTLQGPTPKERERIQALVAKLENDSYAVREAADKELLAVGFVAEPELRRLMKESPSAEVRIRTRRLRAELLSRPQAVLKGHDGEVDSVAFSPDGKLLATGSRDGTLRLWDVASNKEVACLLPSDIKPTPPEQK